MEHHPELRSNRGSYISDMTTLEIDGVVSLLDSFRYVWRGTRRRVPVLESTVAGYFFCSGEQKSLAEVAAALRISIADTIDLTESEFLIISEYFGLYAFPLDLSSSTVSLVDYVSSSSGALLEMRSASRSTITALRRSGLGKIGSVLRPKPGEPFHLQPEADPFDLSWVTSPPAAKRLLDDVEQARLFAAAHEAALDLVDRAPSANEIRVALNRWALRHLDADALVTEYARFRQEHRNCANAALALSLWEITHDSAQLDIALDGRSTIGWVGGTPRATGGRVVQHPKWGAMSSDADAVDMVLLAGEVLNDRDDELLAADLLTDLFIAGKHRSQLPADQADTIVHAVGYGLAARSSWRVVELAKWHAASELLTPTTVSLLGWAAHVASEHRYDALAWRLLNLCDRLSEQLVRDGRINDMQRENSSWLGSMVRSGCRYREATALTNNRKLSRAVSALTSSMSYLDRASVIESLIRGGRNSTISKQLTIDLRQVEILLVAAQLRELGHPLDTVSDELRMAQSVLSSIERKLEAAGDINEVDRPIFEARLETLQIQLDNSPHEEFSELNDSPLDP